ncbi:MAG: T9SS type A sorting domain-containing protein, partial [Bacteroidales bacterium]|nr:T9SS type A sorting domain-containing protein [Bacteroidales bacterium]
ITVNQGEEWWYYFAYNGQSFSLDEEVNIVIPRGQSIQLEVYMNIWAKELVYPVLYFENTLPLVSLVTALNWTESVSDQEKTPIRVYPNPSKGVFNLNLGEGQWDVEVYDMTGRKVYENRMDGRSVLDLGKCPKGVYFLKAMGESRGVTAKIMVQ